MLAFSILSTLCVASVASAAAVAAPVAPDVASSKAPTQQANTNVPPVCPGTPVTEPFLLQVAKTGTPLDGYYGAIRQPSPFFRAGIFHINLTPKVSKASTFQINACNNLEGTTQKGKNFYGIGDDYRDPGYLIMTKPGLYDYFHDDFPELDELSCSLGSDNDPFRVNCKDKFSGGERYTFCPGKPDYTPDSGPGVFLDPSAPGELYGYDCYEIFFDAVF